MEVEGSKALTLWWASASIRGMDVQEFLEDGDRERDQRVQIITLAAMDAIMRDPIFNALFDREIWRRYPESTRDRSVGANHAPLLMSEVLTQFMMFIAEDLEESDGH